MANQNRDDGEVETITTSNPPIIPFPEEVRACVNEEAEEPSPLRSTRRIFHESFPMPPRHHMSLMMWQMENSNLVSNDTADAVVHSWEQYMREYDPIYTREPIGRWSRPCGEIILGEDYLDTYPREFCGYWIERDNQGKEKCFFCDGGLTIVSEANSIGGPCYRVCKECDRK